MNPDRVGAIHPAIIGRDSRGAVNELACYRVADGAHGFRIPACLRRSDGAQRLHRRPQLGGGVVAILTDAAIPCPMVYLVCPPDIAARLWDFSFLGGAQVLVFHRPAHKAYAQQLAAELVYAGCDRSILSAVPEEGV